MFTARSLLCWLAVCLIALPASACRRRAKLEPAPVAPAPVDPVAPAAPTSPQSAPPANLPTGAGTALAPSVSGDVSKETVKTQSRFERNSVWFSKLGKNDPLLRAQVLAEIQRAGLSTSELQELRRQAQQYGIKL